MVVDEDGNGMQATEQPPPVTAYRFKFEFANDEVQQGAEMVRPLTNNRNHNARYALYEARSGHFYVCSFS